MFERDVREPVQVLYAKSMDEARQILYSRYQKDYDIINWNQTLKSHFFGLLNKEVIKVSYIVKNHNSSSPRVEAPAYASQDSASFIKNRDDFLTAMAAKSLDPQLNTPASSSVVQAAPGLSVSQLSEIKKSIEELKQSMAEQVTMAPSKSELHPSIEKIQNLLSDNEFTLKYINFITDKLKALSLEQLENFDYVQRAVIDWIGETIATAPEKTFKSPHVVILVGPTGVGKTTTLVKLAAQYVMNAKKEGRRVEICFITADTMRVGAESQLEKFSQAFNRKVISAETAQDIRQIYEDVKDKVDAIFIDTSGYSPNDSAYIGAMKERLNVPEMNADVYLTVMASTKSRDLVNIMRNYEPFNYNSVIITKCDESEQFGNVVSVIWEKGKTLSYVTDGQKASRCIEKSNPVYFLIRMAGFKVDRIHIEDKFGVN